jgi:hypothetical protein
MGWQTTFTLSRRAKGCHLVTSEVVDHIRNGLEDVEVLRLAAFLLGYFPHRSLMDPYLLVQCIRIIQAGMLFLFMFSAHLVL